MPLHTPTPPDEFFDDLPLETTQAIEQFDPIEPVPTQTPQGDQTRRIVEETINYPTPTTARETTMVGIDEAHTLSPEIFERMRRERARTNSNQYAYRTQRHDWQISSPISGKVIGQEKPKQTEFIYYSPWDELSYVMTNTRDSRRIDRTEELAENGPLIANLKELMKKRKNKKEELHTTVCSQCGRDMMLDKMIETADNSWRCDTCIHETCQRCQECEKFFDVDYMEQNSDGNYYFCEKCAPKMLFTCSACGDTHHIGNQARGSQRCGNCSDGETNDDINFRRNKTYRSDISGSIMRSVRPFGVEIECQYHDHDDAQDAQREMPKGMNCGTDGSINGNGLEFRTPVISGEKGEKFIVDACDNLKRHNFSVDISCGLHVHIDANDLPKTPINNRREFEALKGLFLFYMVYEDVLLSFLPKSRRQSRYCLPLRDDYNIREILQAQSVNDLDKIWYRVTTKVSIRAHKKRKKHDSRYHGINMHTLFAFRHLEIRYHSGTINPQKILEWANLHATIMDRIFENAGNINYSNLVKSNSALDINQKTTEFFNTIPSLPESAREYFLTRQEIFRQHQKSMPISTMGDKKARDLLSKEMEN